MRIQKRKEIRTMKRRGRHNTARALRQLAKEGIKIPSEVKVIMPINGKMTQYSTGVVDLYRQPDGKRTRPGNLRGGTGHKKV